ncbi:19583_t:CDS:2, partial [Funneliformis geosporum]
NAKGWVNEDKMIYWVENVWFRKTVDLSNPNSLLVLDSFRATNMTVIPGGLTLKLQPLDISINKSFKSN